VPLPKVRTDSRVKSVMWNPAATSACRSEDNRIGLDDELVDLVDQRTGERRAAAEADI
jgi:hypothetical protein